MVGETAAEESSALQGGSKGGGNVVLELDACGARL